MQTPFYQQLQDGLSAIKNEDLGAVAAEVQGMLKSVIDEL